MGFLGPLVEKGESQRFRSRLLSREVRILRILE